MHEKLLQFIWRYQYFNFSNLCTCNGEKLEIIHAGRFNTDQGPDFLEARIRLDGTILVGHIELHVCTSDWLKHHHEKDTAYDNVILHVVWFHDRAWMGDRYLPTLELQPYVSIVLLEKYRRLMEQEASLFVPCQHALPALSGLGWIHWLERLGVERLERKSQAILQRLRQCNNDWNGLLWGELAYNFGLKNNAETFRSVADSISWRTIARQQYDLPQLEALLMGQAGLLEMPYKDAYPQLLQREYIFLRQKYGLRKVAGNVQFLRMRPQNFPTIRLSQLANLLFSRQQLFSRLLEAQSVKELRSFFHIVASPYWNDHFMFDKTAGTVYPKWMGTGMAENMIINTVVPLLFAYGVYLQDQRKQELALHFLTESTAEKNTVIDHWKSCGIPASNAMESQALLELYHNYCQEKKCLDCAVGTQLLRANP